MIRSQDIKFMMNAAQWGDKNALAAIITGFDPAPRTGLKKWTLPRKGVSASVDCNIQCFEGVYVGGFLVFL